MKAIIVLLALSLVACTDDGPSAAEFVGAYHTTITVSGSGSQSYVDSMSISKGSTSDLIVSSQQLGALKATIIDKGSFAIDQQQVTLTSATGQAFSVTIEGQGTVTGGVINASGQLSSSTGALSFTIAGSKL